MSKQYSFWELYKLWIVKQPSDAFYTIDVKPYPLRPNSIIIFMGSMEKQTSGPAEFAYEYNEEKDRFVWIPDAKKYKEILNDIYPTPLKDLVEHKKEEWM